MSRLERLRDQPFAEASSRGFHLLLAWGVVLLALVGLLGRTPLLTVAVAGYLLGIPAYVGYRVRTWNEALAGMDAPTGREEASVAGVDADGRADDGEGGGEGAG